MTLHMLIKNQKQYTEEQWIAIAKTAGVSTELDKEIDIDDLNKLRSCVAELKCKESQREAEREAAAYKSLEKLVRENQVFIDPSCLMVPAAKIAFDRMIPILSQSKRKIYIPKVAVDELELLAKNSSNEKEKAAASEGFEILKTLNEIGLLTVRTMDKKDIVGDYGLHVICAYFRVQYPILVITQNEKLAEELLRLNDQHSVRGKTLIVKRVNKYGFLSNTVEKKTVSVPFHICSEPRSQKDQPLSISMVPATGDDVYDGTHGGTIHLLERIGKGAEGYIYRTNTPYVAKIYYKESCTQYRFEKIERMIQAGLFEEGICFPVAVLYNKAKERVGYLLPEAKGETIQLSIFKKANLLNLFPKWKKTDLVHTIITMLRKIDYIHSKGILLGDINPGNIMVESPDKVYLIDTDSYQIDDLPCPVGYPTYTAPEMLMKQKEGLIRTYSEVLRTKKEEDFAVATLIFMMLMGGKPPYSQTGGTSITDNILSLHFPYAVGDRHGEGVPDGSWRYIWSHLTRRMKVDFLKTFNKEDGNSEFNIEERLSVKEWIKELQDYENVLKLWEKMLQDDPFSLKFDPVSLELYPSRLKHEPDVQYVMCKGGCGREYKINDPALKAGYCSECQRKGEKATCWYDGKEFVFTNFERYYKKMKEAPILCPECRKDNSAVYRHECEAPGCTNQIEYTRWQVAMAKKKAAESGYTFAFPKICKPCKEKGIRLNPKKDVTKKTRVNPEANTVNTVEKARKKRNILERLFAQL